MIEIKDVDPTLRGVNRRLGAVEVAQEQMSESLGKLVTLTQRIQWTFTGLVIYYIMDNGEVTKILIKAVLS